jgi:hypothetical protein
MSSKRLLFVVAMLPVTLPLALLSIFAEWLYFGPLKSLLNFCEWYQRRLSAFANSLDKASKGGGNA